MSNYVRHLDELAYNLRLSAAARASAPILPTEKLTPYVSSIEHAPGWVERFDSQMNLGGGTYKVAVNAGEYYHFRTTAFWTPSLTIFDADGFTISYGAGTSYGTSGAAGGTFFAKEDGFIFVQAYAQYSPVFANASLEVKVDFGNQGSPGSDNYIENTSSPIYGSGYVGGGGNDFITSSIANRRNDLAGADGNDTFNVGQSGADYTFIDGGSGIDTIIISKSSLGVTLTPKSNQYLSSVKDWYTITGMNSDNLITFYGVESIQFTDKTISISDLPGFKSFTIDTPFDDSLNGSAQADTLASNLGSDQLNGFAGDDTLSSGMGNDFLYGGLGNDSLDGGEGTDYALYAGSRENYTITYANGFATVRDNKGAEGVDSLVGVERLSFSDVSVVMDLAGTAGQAYRIYQAAFDRTPDISGLGYWMAHMESGMSLKTVAHAFVTSAEFITVYGAAPSNAQLISKFYENVLGRAGDQSGVEFWISILDGNLATVAEVLASFSESAENVTNLVGAMQNGVEFTPWIFG